MVVASPRNLPELPAELEHQLQWLANTSFMIPAAARKALELARDPDCDVDEFLDVVRRDPKLAADILMMANSGGFATSQRILDLHQAIVRLGFRQCRNLIITAAFASLMHRSTAAQQTLRREIWRHSFATATICQLLNRELRLGYQGEEFTAGLVHDFGRLALVTLFPNLVTADGDSVSEPESMREHERRVCGADHCEVGAWAVAVNELPELLVDAVRFHHDPGVCPAQHRPLCALVAMAEQMARHLLETRSAEGFGLNPESPADLLRDADRLPLAEIWPATLRDLLEQAISILSRDPLSMF